MVVFGQKWIYSGKSGCNRENLLYSGNVVVIEQGGSVWTKVVVFGQKWLCSGKSGCIRAKLVVFVQSGCIQAKWLFLGKSCCIRAKAVVFGQSGCIR